MVSGEPIGLANWNYKVQLVFPIEVQHSSWLPINAIWDQFMGTGMTSWTHSLFLTGYLIYNVVIYMSELLIFGY